MIKSVKFKGFRGIKRCKKPLPLAKFNLLIGPNNACKTTILEGLSLLMTFWHEFYHPLLYNQTTNKFQILIQLHNDRDKVRGQKSLIYRYAGRANISYQLIVLRELQDTILYVNIDDVGAGIKRFLVSALWLEALSPQLVLWDDLETAAHPALITQMLEWLSNHEWQVVASTHSIDVLRGLVQADIEGASVIQLRKDANDVLRHKVLSLDDVAELLDKGQDVRKLMWWD